MQLKPHQISGANWLASKRHALLADEMRVGKTLTALEAARLGGATRIAIICPAGARFNWARNIREHLGVEANVWLSRRDRWGKDSDGVVVTSYDLVLGLLDKHWDVVVVDESHYLRRCTSARTKLILGKNGLIHKTQRMWFLSGTPAVNHYGELWQMLYICGRYSGSYEKFLGEFCIVRRTPYGQHIVGSKSADRLRDLLEGFWLRRKFADIAPELPPIEISEYTVNFPADVAMLNSLMGPEGDVLRAAMSDPDPMAALEAASPACATLRRQLGLAMVSSVAEVVRSDLDGNTNKIVLFTYHREVLAQLMKQLDCFSPVSIAGGDNAANRAKAEFLFRTSPTRRVFIGQIIAAGTNIDLSAASDAIMVESSWVPGENAQAMMRLQNMNQTNRVSVRFLAMADSLHQTIQRVVIRKTKDLHKLFG